MTSSNGNIFRVTGHLCGEFTGHRLIPRQKGQRRRALIFSLICTWINGWVNNGEAGDFYDVIVMEHFQWLVTKPLLVARIHSIEIPSMVDPQWNILYWRSRWILITVCWGAFVCEWGTTSVYFWITYVCFIHRILPVLALGCKYQHWLFYLCQNYHLKDRSNIYKNSM